MYSEILIPQTKLTQEGIQNFWSPKTTGEDSEFLIPKYHRRFRISDPPNNTGDSEFLIPQEHRRGFRISDPPKQHRRFRISDPPRTQENIQKFWSPKQHRGSSEFLIPQIIQERIQNIWSPKNTGEYSEFLIAQTTHEINNFWSSKQYRKVFRNTSDNPNNLREISYFSLWSQSSEMSQNLRLKSTHDSGAVQGLIVPRYKLKFNC